MDSLLKFDLDQIHYDIQNYHTAKAVQTSYLELCSANEAMLEDFKNVFKPMERIERNRSRQALKVMKFTSYSKTMAGVPRGFKGKLLPYMEDIDEASAMLIKGYNDAMPKYSEALSELLQERTLPDYYVKPLKDTMEEQTTYTAKLGGYFDGDKEWLRIGTLTKSVEELGLIYASSEAAHAILDPAWLDSIEHDVKVNTTYMRSISTSLHGTSDATFKKKLRKAGEAGFGMAKLVELVAARAWETTGVLRTVKNLRQKTINDHF